MKVLRPHCCMVLIQGRAPVGFARMGSIATRHSLVGFILVVHFCIVDGAKSHDRHDEMSGVRILVANQWPLHNCPLSLGALLLVVISGCSRTTLTLSLAKHFAGPLRLALAITKWR
jgi:hypothetical protein